jgi:hypothetical protein
LSVLIYGPKIRKIQPCLTKVIRNLPKEKNPTVPSLR